MFFAIPHTYWVYLHSSRKFRMCWGGFTFATGIYAGIYFLLAGTKLVLSCDI